MSQRLIRLSVLLSASLAVVHGQAPANSFKTPWGEPDLQGTWTSEPELGVPFERPAEFGERQTLTEAEFAARQAQAAKQLATDNAEFEVETADTANAGAVVRPPAAAALARARPALAPDLDGDRSARRAGAGAERRGASAPAARRQGQLRQRPVQQSRGLHPL